MNLITFLALIAGIYFLYKLFIKRKKEEIIDEEQFLLGPAYTDDEEFDIKVSSLIRQNKKNNLPMAITTRESIRCIILQEVMSLVRQDCLKEQAVKLHKQYIESGNWNLESQFAEFLKSEEKKNLDKNAKLQKLKGILEDNNISERWLLKNGGFKNVPYKAPEVNTEFLNISGNKYSDVMNFHSSQRLKHERESFGTYTHHAFGHELDCLSIDDIPISGIELMIQFKDRLIGLHKTNSSQSTYQESKGR